MHVWVRHGMLMVNACNDKAFDGKACKSNVM
jgi:hypothetical protein